MQFHEVPGDGQPQTSSAEFAGSSALCLVEAFEDCVASRVESRSAVLDGKNEAFVSDRERAADASAGRREFESVGEQIEQYPLQLLRIDLRTNNVGRDDDIGNRPLRSQSIEVCRHGAHQAREIDVDVIHCRFGRIELRQIEQIIDVFEQRCGIVPDYAQIVPLHLGKIRAGSEH